MPDRFQHDSCPFVGRKRQQRKEFFDDVIGEILNDPVLYDDDATLSNIVGEPYGEF